MAAAIAVVGVAVLVIIPVGFVSDTAQSSVEPANEISKNLGRANGPADALRHCIMNCRMTRKYGQTIAQLASWYHEAPLIPSGMRGGGSDNVEGRPARVMDEFNNACGQEIAKTWPDDMSCVWGCEKALRDGNLYVLDPSQWDWDSRHREHEFEVWQAEGPRSFYPIGAN